MNQTILSFLSKVPQRPTPGLTPTQQKKIMLSKGVSLTGPRLEQLGILLRAIDLEPFTKEELEAVGALDLSCIENTTSIYLENTFRGAPVSDLTSSTTVPDSRLALAQYADRDPLALINLVLYLAGEVDGY